MEFYTENKNENETNKSSFPRGLSPEEKREKEDFLEDQKSNWEGFYENIKEVDDANLAKLREAARSQRLSAKEKIYKEGLSKESIKNYFICRYFSETLYLEEAFRRFRPHPENLYSQRLPSAIENTTKLYNVLSELSQNNPDSYENTTKYIKERKRIAADKLERLKENMPSLKERGFSDAQIEKMRQDDEKDIYFGESLSAFIQNLELNE